MRAETVTAVRLIDGYKVDYTKFLGRIEVQLAGVPIWGRVNWYGFDHDAANTVCRMLGRSGGSIVRGFLPGGADRPYLLVGVQCFQVGRPGCDVDDDFLPTSQHLAFARALAPVGPAWRVSDQAWHQPESQRPREATQPWCVHPLESQRPREATHNRGAAEEDLNRESPNASRETRA